MNDPELKSRMEACFVLSRALYMKEKGNMDEYAQQREMSANKLKEKVLATMVFHCYKRINEEE